jgi:hypothetical protein
VVLRNTGTANGSRQRDALIALAGFLALFAWPVREALFDPSRVLSGVDTVTSQLPWSAPGPRNAELADQGRFDYPAQRFVIDSWLRGDPPLWNPHIYAGVPAAGNPRMGVFDPQTLVLAALERIGGRVMSDWGLAAFAWLRLSFAAFGAFLLARRLGLARGGALIAGLSFGTCGFLTLWLGTSAARVAWLLPWLLLALEHLRGERWRRAFVAAGVVFALAIYGGQPETAFFCGLCAVAWSFAIWRAEREAGARAFVALGSGALLAMPVVLPCLEYLAHSGVLAARSAREAPPIDWMALGVLAIAGGVVLRGRELAPAPDAGDAVQQRFVAGFALILALAIAAAAQFVEWPAALRLALLPDLFGAPGASAAGWIGAGSYLEEASPWVATLTLALAFGALLSTRDHRLAHRAWIAGLGVVALLLALRAPGLVAIYHRVPLVGLCAPARLAPVAALMLALLAGEAFECAPRMARTASAGALALVLGALCAFAPSAPRYAPIDAAEELDAPDGIVNYTRLPEPVLSSGRARLEGWIDPGLEVGSLGIRVEPFDAATPPAHELPLPVEISSAPWSDTPHASGRAAPPAGAHWFRAQHLDVRELAEGRWRFSLEIRGANGQWLSTRRAAICEVRRPRSLDPVSVVLALLGLAAAALARPRANAWGGWPTALACAAVAAQAFEFGRGAHPAVPRDECFVATRTTSILAHEFAHARYLADAGVLPANSGLVYGLDSLDGCDGLDIATFDAARKFALKPGVHPLLGWNASGVDVASPAFRLLGVHALVRASPWLQTDAERRAFELIAAPRDAQQVAETWIYRARDALPRAFCVTNVIDVDAAREAWSKFDPFAAAYLEPGVPWNPGRLATKSSVSDITSSNDEVRMRVELDGDALLVLAEQHFPGWHVEVDGARRDLLCVDSILRGVALGAGEHRVVFSYSPTSLSAGFVLAGIGLVALLVFALRGRAASRA